MATKNGSAKCARRLSPEVTERVVTPRTAPFDPCVPYRALPARVRALPPGMKDALVIAVFLTFIRRAKQFGVGDDVIGALRDGMPEHLYLDLRGTEQFLMRVYASEASASAH